MVFVVAIFLCCLLCLTSVAQAFTLITFDVDGTLVRSSGNAARISAHARAFGHAVGTVLCPSGNPTQGPADLLPEHLYHGSTDGLILLRLARAALGVEPSDGSFERLDDLMTCMYNYIAVLDDDEVADAISPLPGVIETLSKLATKQEEVLCGLVTGNVEGIARRKMRAVGILDTGALSPPSNEQQQQHHRWPNSEAIGFLGGFGSDFCSGDIDNLERNHLDRAEQIAIATRRGQSILNEQLQQQQVPSSVGTATTRPKVLSRVVHVGDAPADVLAAKAFSELCRAESKDLCVGMVAVATGSFLAEELRDLAGETIPGIWEPVVLENGMADPNTFLASCGLSEYK